MSEKFEKYLSIIVAAVLLICIAINIAEMIPSAQTSAAPKTTDWGLSFGEQGTQPRGNADSDYLRQFNAYYVGPAEEKCIYITFDGGYENGNTGKILDTLKAHNAPAAFFVTGHFMKENADLVNRMYLEGHIVGNHTANHPNMTKLSNIEDFKKELYEIEEMYLNITGQKLPKFYRPPEGQFSEENLKYAQGLGYTTVFWSLAYADWHENSQPTREFALSKLLPRMHNGAVLLLHSTSSTNAEILDELLTTWEGEGYAFKPLFEMK